MLRFEAAPWSTAVKLVSAVGTGVLLAVTYALYRAVPRGTRVPFAETFGTFMVAVSDNAATNVLIERLGMANVNELLAGLGLEKTRLQRKMLDLDAARAGRENVATPRELVDLLEAIYRGKVLGPLATEDFLKILSLGKDSPIPELIPDDVRIANKPGELEGVRCDAGIVYATGRPFVVAVMTSYAANERAAESVISRIAAVAYESFERLGRSSPYGRIISERNSGVPKK